MSDFDYDLECYPNFFSCFAVLEDTKEFVFEISEWKDDSEALYTWLMSLVTFNHRMVGFNNCSYDYTLLHSFIESKGTLGYRELYSLSQCFFNESKRVNKFGGFNQMVIWENHHLIPQVDLFKIHHFDNKNKSTSLKMIEFNMRSRSIKDLPFDPLKNLTYDEARILLAYNGHDTRETFKFHNHTKPMIEFRDRLSVKYQRNFTNFSDAKIGAEVLMIALEKKGIPKKVNGKLNQTWRDSIPLNDVILPYVKFDRPEFNEVLDFFKKSTIEEKQKNGLLKLKSFFKWQDESGKETGKKGLSCTLDGFQFDFGAGGIHGSLKRTIVRSSDTHDLLDWDVASYYPNLAIKNKFFPEHLTEIFCDVQLSLFNERKTYAKKTPENASLKLSMNASYGNSSSEYSPMLDQKFTMSITINGQLLLCMLAEKLMEIPDLKMVQINTDGLTFLCPKGYREHAKNLWKWWEGLTQLELEEAEYKMMAIRDVNNYLAVTTGDYVKRIGCYAHELSLDNGSTRELSWHKNQSSVVVAKAAEAALVRGENIYSFIKNHNEPMDFMLRTKVPRSSTLELRTPVKWGNEILGESRQKLQNISRYYVSHGGGKLIKTMPHTKTQLENWNTRNHYQHEDNGDYHAGDKGKSGKYKIVRPENRKGIPPRDIGIDVKSLVTDCSTMDDFNIDTLNYEHYIEEAKKIINPLLLGELE
jgi:hypothetical protein